MYYEPYPKYNVCTREFDAHSTIFCPMIVYPEFLVGVISLKMYQMLNK